MIGFAVVVACRRKSDASVLETCCTDRVGVPVPESGERGGWLGIDSRRDRRSGGCGNDESECASAEYGSTGGIAPRDRYANALGMRVEAARAQNAGCELDSFDARTRLTWFGDGWADRHTAERK